MVRGRGGGRLQEEAKHAALFPLTTGARCLEGAPKHHDDMLSGII